jgi:hypothetical protein
MTVAPTRREKLNYVTKKAMGLIVDRVGSFNGKAERSEEIQDLVVDCHTSS